MSTLTTSEKKALHTYSGNMTWFRTRYAELTKEFANKYVAINAGGVIDSDYNPDRLIRRLRDTYGNEATMTFAIEFVTKSEVELIL